HLPDVAWKQACVQYILITGVVHDPDAADGVIYNTVCTVVVNHIVDNQTRWCIGIAEAACSVGTHIEDDSIAVGVPGVLLAGYDVVGNDVMESGIVVVEL